MTESDHDILIEVRGDVKHLIEKNEEIQVDINNLEGRIRIIEIAGSREAAEAIKRCETVETKLESLSKTGAAKQGEKNLWDSLWVKGGIVASVLLGVVAFVNDVRRGLF